MHTGFMWVSPEGKIHSMGPGRRRELILKRVFKKWGGDTDRIDLAMHLGVNELIGECSMHCNGQKMPRKFLSRKLQGKLHEMVL